MTRLAVETRCDRRALERQWRRIAGDEAPELHLVVTYFRLLAGLERFFADSRTGAHIPMGLRQRARAVLGAMPLTAREAHMLAMRHFPIPPHVFGEQGSDESTRDSR